MEKSCPDPVSVTYFCFIRPFVSFELATFTPMKSCPAPIVFLAGLSLLLPACTGWPRGWNQAKSISHQNSPAGAWMGNWKSIPTGHTGQLRCVVFPSPEKPDSWQFRYRASWAKVLCAGFTVDCQAVRQSNGSWRITGSRDLGPLFGGVFTHTATLHGDQLNATYQAAADHGTLTLRRLEVSLP